MDEQALERVYEAIEQARCPDREGPYGLYDYSIGLYKDAGLEKPHHVRDFRDPKSDSWGRTIFRSADPEEARAEFERLTRSHIARAAVDAIIAELKTPETPPSLI